MQIKFISCAVSLAVLMAVVLPPISYSDNISPSIKDRGKVYSKEAPDTLWYGTGAGGREAEASVLRFEVERLMADGKMVQATIKAKKAVQLDPGDTGGHLLLARCLSNKLFTSTGPIDEKLLADCVVEWKMLWLHDVDTQDQAEGKYQLLKLKFIARKLAKEKKEEQKAHAQAREVLAKSQNSSGKQIATRPIEESNVTPGAAPSHTNAGRPTQASPDLSNRSAEASNNAGSLNTSATGWDNSAAGSDVSTSRFNTPGNSINAPATTTTTAKNVPTVRNRQLASTSSTQDASTSDNSTSTQAPSTTDNSTSPNPTMQDLLAGQHKKKFILF